MKYLVSSAIAIAAVFSLSPVFSQFQYRSDDNSDIIRSILEDRVPVRKSAQETTPSKNEKPAGTQPLENQTRNEQQSTVVQQPQKQVQPKQKKNKIQDSAQRGTKTKAKKTGGEIPAASGSDKVLLETGISLFEGGNDSAAMEKFRQIREKYPTSQYIDQSSIWLARSLVRSGKAKDGLSELERIREDSGEYPASLYLAGTIYRDIQQYDRANEQFYKLSSRFPGDDLADDALIAAGKIHLSQKNGTLALSAASQVVRLYSDRDTLDDAYFLIGMILEKDPVLRDIEKARLVFKKFIYRAEIEKLDVFSQSPLLDRVKKEIAYIEKIFYKN